jgi:hypothetical protein
MVGDVKNPQGPRHTSAPGPRLADEVDVTVALTEKTQEILDQLPVRRLQLSQPVDARGARIRVSVEPGYACDLPAAVVVESAGGPVLIPLEASEDYRVVKPRERDTLPAVNG